MSLYFNVAQDVNFVKIIIDALCQITVPLTADELPPLPQREGALLIRNLKMVSFAFKEMYMYF